jgi:probable rRNA maturation factor
MIEIQCENDAFSDLKIDLLEKAANETLKEQGFKENVDLTVLLSDDAQVQALNRDYRGYDKPTDVLSFEAHERDPETSVLYLGDIIISLERATAQAEQAGHPLLAEVQLLVVHGVLHLLGHDHAEPEEKAKMWQHQAEILACLGLSQLKIQEE